ncbi:MAG: hydroxymethylbilane synthase [Planctomycetales bacterium]
MMADKIRIGTRGSALARWQADWVAGQLRALDVDVELIAIETAGDLQKGAIGSLGSTGVFTKQIQLALVDDRIDLAVHSLKDLPTDPVHGLTLAAVPAREKNADVLVGNVGWQDLATGSRLGTGSLRRQAQILNLRSDLKVIDIRGNVETRIAKLEEGHYDAIVLAQAGLIRLGLEHRIVEIFSLEQFLPAVGQGALGLETRVDDNRTRELLQSLNHEPTHQAVLAERSLLATLRGGCLAPVGAWGRCDETGQLFLDAVVLNATGEQRLHVSTSGSDSDAIELGQRAATRLLEQGAARLIESARQ